MLVRVKRRLKTFISFILSFALASVAPVLAAASGQASADKSGPQQIVSCSIAGTVFDTDGKPVAEAAVQLDPDSSPVQSRDTRIAKTSANGDFFFSNLRAGAYEVRVEKDGLHRETKIAVLSGGDQKKVSLVLGSVGSSQKSLSSSEAMQFADKPNFTVAGVTDWTAVGGHGSDSTLRTSEDLARETAALKAERPASIAGDNASAIDLRAALATHPRSFEANHRLGEYYLHIGDVKKSIPVLRAAYQVDPRNAVNAYELALSLKQDGDFSEAHQLVEKLLARTNNGNLHRLAGELDEELGDPLAAVHQDELAVRLDSSEENYFSWGSELLLHRAVWQAVAVFRNGSTAYPRSARMLAALGTALFASAAYEEAAERLCDAADLNPADPHPYAFLGRIEMAAPAPLPCVEQKLALFVQQQPANAYAHYLYAMAILKRQELSANQADLQLATMLLEKAVALDSKCYDAYLQLGIMDFARHNYPQAISNYSKAIAANPKLGEAHYRLGVVYDRTGKAEKAQEEFQLHTEIEKRQAAFVDEQRREIKQFLVVLKSSVSPPAPQ